MSLHELAARAAKKSWSPEWTSADVKPKHTVLLACEGKVLRGCWIEKFEELAAGDYWDDPDHSDYHEKEDEWYLKPGWFECCNYGPEDYWGYRIHGEVTHWCELPELPELPETE